MESIRRAQPALVVALLALSWAVLGQANQGERADEFGSLQVAKVSEWKYDVRIWPRTARCAGFWRRLNAHLTGQELKQAQLSDAKGSEKMASQADLGQLTRLSGWLRSRVTGYPSNQVIEFVDDCVEALRDAGAATTEPPSVVPSSGELERLKSELMGAREQLERAHANTDWLEKFGAELADKLALAEKEISQIDVSRSLGERQLRQEIERQSKQVEKLGFELVASKSELLEMKNQLNRERASVEQLKVELVESRARAQSSPAATDVARGRELDDCRRDLALANGRSGPIGGERARTAELELTSAKSELLECRKLLDIERIATKQLRLDLASCNEKPRDSEQQSAGQAEEELALELASCRSELLGAKSQLDREKIGTKQLRSELATCSEKSQSLAAALEANRSELSQCRGRAASADEQAKSAGHLGAVNGVLTESLRRSRSELQAQRERADSCERERNSLLGAKGQAESGTNSNRVRVIPIQDLSKRRSESNSHTETYWTNYANSFESNYAKNFAGYQ